MSPKEIFKQNPIEFILTLNKPEIQFLTTREKVTTIQ